MGNFDQDSLNRLLSALLPFWACLWPKTARETNVLLCMLHNVIEDRVDCLL